MKNRIAELRKAKKLTLNDVARKLGVSQGYVSQLQHKKALSAPHRAKLAQIFGVPADQVAALDKTAVVRRRRKGQATGKRRGARSIGAAITIAAAAGALAALSKSFSPQARRLIEMLPSMSTPNRAVLLKLAQSFVNMRK